MIVCFFYYSGLHNYKISVKEWVSKTNAMGLKAAAGRYGGTYAHKDLAFEFGMWISQMKLLTEEHTSKLLERKKDA